MLKNTLLTTGLVLALSSCLDPAGDKAQTNEDPIGDDAPRAELVKRQQAFKIVFELPQDKEWVELRTHSTRHPQLQGGLQLRFTRLDNVLYLNVIGPGLRSDKQLKLVDLDPLNEQDDRFTFYIDVDNSESPATLDFWFTSHDFTLTSDCSNCDATNRWIHSDDFDLFPSDFPEYYRSSTQGVGRYWGTFRTSGAKLISVKILNPIQVN